MRVTVVRILFLLIACSLPLTAAFAQPVPSVELINNAKDYDGKTVVYSGEVIGDVMRRGNFAWANVNDGANAIGIWIENSQAQYIAYTGTYKARGDTVEISGAFHRSCPEHGGDLDIHAASLRKVKPGSPITEKLNTSKGNQAAVLMGVLCLIWILSLSKRK